MAKDPAFLFYPGDWNLGTMHMTHLEKGCYMDLLMLQFARGKFTIAQAKHMLQSSFDLVWATLIEKFETDGSYYWNARLEIEKEKRKRFTDSRKNNALKSKKETKHMSKHMQQHMENENENTNENEIKDKKGGVGENSNLNEKSKQLHSALCEYFAISETSNFNNFRTLREFCSVLQFNQKTDVFINQFKHYQEYKAKSDEKKHGLKGFLGTLEKDFEDGGWNSENWEHKNLNFKPSTNKNEKPDYDKIKRNAANRMEEKLRAKYGETSD